MRIPFPPKWRRTWNCCNDAQLAAYVDGTLSGPARERAEKHLAGCPSCREGVATLVRSEREPAAPVPPAWIARVRHLADSPPPRQRAAGWAWAGALACLVVAAAAITLTLRTQPNLEMAQAPVKSAPAVSATPATEARADQVRNLGQAAGAPVVITPANGASVARDLQVQWQTLPSALSYEVRILNSAGDTIWRTQTSADRLQIPAAASLRHGQKYFVLISASLPTGKTVHAKAVSFQVEAQQENR